MNRIRLIWSRMWNVLSDFFLLVGLSENLSVAIFVMDSLQQLAMKFLERDLVEKQQHKDLMAPKSNLANDLYNLYAALRIYLALR
ncbi:hypothetical protein PVK06_001642 [Gossypium arboreum]|uniref:Uncharacterized protein n=1 Tax=Gossypium arboreum TaxID=29729 RepID=A0ABR0R1I1_GOSAR|nr:hypothetical protein PVK06_001642 [Gossypium arboreum]